MAAPATAPRRRSRPATAAPSTRAARNSRAIANARAAHAAHVTAPATRPVAPRRKSGPAPRPVRAPRREASLVARLVHGRGAVVLDGLLRGRGWVVLVGALLTGIVFLNVSVLQLNRGIARTDAQSSTLERTNSTLRARVARLDSAERIQRVAQAHGFVLPQPGDVTYLTPHARSDARLAAERISPPAPQQAAAPQQAVAVQPATAPVQQPLAAPVQQQPQQAPVATPQVASPAGAPTAAGAVH